MTEFMKTVLTPCTKTAICTFVSQLQKALKSLQEEEKRDESKHRKIKEWRKKRLTFLLITGAQPKAGTGHKMQSVSVVFSTLHCEGYIADLRYIAGSLLLGVLAGSLKSYPRPF